MLYKDNWMIWYYDGFERGIKTRPDSIYKLKFTPTITQPIKSYKEQLLDNAQLIRDSFSDPFDLLFSGGVDSEVILRCNIELGIPINVFIFRYENNYNLVDVTHALRICKELNVTPTVIDFNLKKFFENDAYDIWKLGYFAAPGRLPHLKMTDYVDNIPIMGDGCPYWSYSGDQWLFEIDEVSHCQTIYGTTVGRTILADWYEYSPEIILSHLQTPAMQKLISGSSADFNKSKYLLHNSIWPEIVIRPKLVGFESLDHWGNPIQIPEFMMDFRRKYIDSTLINLTAYKFTAEELVSQLCFN